MKKLILISLALFLTACNSPAPVESERIYQSQSPDECSRIRFMCVEGKQAFFDETGCGCEPQEGESPEATPPIPVEEKKIEEVSEASDDGLFSGDYIVSGYATTEVFEEGFCQMNCKMYDYVMFHIEESNNQDLMEYIDLNKGNSYVRERAIGLGCIENGIIQYTNRTDENGSKDFSVSQDLSKTIIESTKENPVSLLLKFLPLSGGQDAPTCYSHVHEIETISS